MKEWHLKPNLTEKEWVGLGNVEMSGNQGGLGKEPRRSET